MFREFGYKSETGFVRNILKPATYIKKFLQEHRTDCYATFASYDIPDQESALISAPLVFDIDSNDLVEAKAETLKLLALLGKIDLKPAVYFSGAKGFHVIIPSQVLDVKPRFYLIDVYRNLVRQMCKKNNFRLIDTKIYERKRLFRISNTINGKTGLYKIPLTAVELEKWSVDEIKKRAEKRRVLKYNFTPNQKLKEFYLLAEKMFLRGLERKSEHKIKSPGEIKMLPCVKKLLEEGAPEGERNDSCYTLALFFKSQNLLEEHAVDILQGYSGLSLSETTATVRSAYRGPYKFGCNENELVQKHCDKDHCKFGFQKKSMLELTWDKESLIREVKKDLAGKFDTALTFGDEKIDKAWGAIRKDELIICCADSGAGKTTYAFWLMKKNAEKGNKILFCSLEMATRALIARACREMCIPFDYMADWIREHDVYFYKDGQRLSTKNLRRNLEESVKQDFGIDLIIIDHLGYVEKPTDRIYESFSQIAEDLSNFTKDLNIPVLLLTHFTKGQAGASNKPRSVNELLGTGRLRDFASKVFQIWYPQEGNIDDITAFILHKNRYGKCCSLKMRYADGGYTYHESDQVTSL